MANIIDYVEWRGDLNLNKTEFNEIDSLILNRFSYFFESSKYNFIIPFSMSSSLIDLISSKIAVII